MDEKDRRIIEILEKNARTPFTQIAKEIGLSEGAVRKRVEALERKGVIRKYVAVVDPKKLGYNNVTILGLDVDPTKLLDIANEVAKIKEVRTVCLSTGDHMIMAEIWAKDGKELSEILAKKIGKIDGIKRLCPAILLEKIKGL
ncbi:MAG: transcriptional regulator [Thermoplasmata archaeon]|nr:MAG: transcriptional regulator [Thermoplasmata archaeon]